MYRSGLIGSHALKAHLGVLVVSGVLDMVKRLVLTVFLQMQLSSSQGQ
jgi:hypothetical protein